MNANKTEIRTDFLEMMPGSASGEGQVHDFGGRQLNSPSNTLSLSNQHSRENNGL